MAAARNTNGATENMKQVCNKTLHIEPSDDTYENIHLLMSTVMNKNGATENMKQVCNKTFSSKGI
jgi:hypothetical protein